MVGSGACGTHAPIPHDEFICHGTGERRQNIINELKMILDKADDRPCFIPEIRPNNKMRPIMNYPGYVDKRHPAYQPPEPPPIITHTGVAELRQTSEPGRVADDPPNVCYNVRQYRKKNPAPSTESVKAVELRGGTMYNKCECIKRNGLQDQCPRRECGGRPECVAVNPGPCCAPAMAIYTQDMEMVNSPPEKPELCATNKGVAICCCCHNCS